MYRWPVYDEEQIRDAIAVLRSGKVNAWTGNKVREFEAAYAEYLGRRHATDRLAGEERGGLEQVGEHQQLPQRRVAIRLHQPRRLLGVGPLLSPAVERHHRPASGTVAEDDLSRRTGYRLVPGVVGPPLLEVVRAADHLEAQRPVPLERCGEVAHGQDRCHVVEHDEQDAAISASGPRA